VQIWRTKPKHSLFVLFFFKQRDEARQMWNDENAKDMLFIIFEGAPEKLGQACCRLGLLPSQHLFVKQHKKRRHSKKYTRKKWRKDTWLLHLSRWRILQAFVP
jgi:hypothetical protein